MSVSMCERTSTSSLGRGIPTHLPVTEDTPPDYLEGHMQLLCVLPNGKCVDIAVERRTPMMDVLVQICTSRRLAPGDHVLSLTDTAKQNLPFKPSTPIGSLDAHTVHVVAKSRELSNGKVSWPSAKAAQPFEPTIRLQVHLPRNQLHVVRVSPRSTLGEILHTVCEAKALDPELCEIRHPTNLDERLRLSCCLADYKLQEITIAFRGNSSPLTAADLPAMESGSNKSLCRPTSEVAASEKKKKGIFGFVFGKKSPRQNASEFRSPPVTDELPAKIELPVKIELPAGQNISRISPPRGGHETNGIELTPPHPPTRLKKRPAPAPPPGAKVSPSPVVVNGKSGDHSVKEEQKASSVISTSSSSDKSGCAIHSRQSSDSSSGYHESSVVSEREPTQKSLGTSSLSDVAAPPRLRPKLASGVGQSPRAVSVINLSHSSALHSGPSSNLTKTQSHSHTSLTSASKKRKAPAPPPFSALSSSAVSASTTTTTTTTTITPTPSVGAGTASHRSSLTDSTISATSSSIVSSFVAVPTDRAPSRSSNSSAAPVGEKVTVRQSESRKVESQQPQPEPLPRASSVAKMSNVGAISSQKSVTPETLQAPPIPSPRKKIAPVPLPRFPVDDDLEVDDLEIDDWSLFQQKRESFSSSSTIPSLAPPPKPRRQWQVSEEWPRGSAPFGQSTPTSDSISSDDVTSVESLRTKQVRQLKKAFHNPEWNSPLSDHQKPATSFPEDLPKLTVRRHSNLSNGANKNNREDVRVGVSATGKRDVARKKLRKRSSREVKGGQHVLRYSTRKYSTPSTPSSSESEDAAEEVVPSVNKHLERGEELLAKEAESNFPRCASDGNFWREDLGSDSTSMAASDIGPVMDHSKRGLIRKTLSNGQSEQSLGISGWEKVEVSDLSAWFDDIFNGGGTGPRSDTSSELSFREKGTKNLIYRESSAESGEDGIYERVRPMPKILSAERKPVIEATENQPVEALYSVVVKKPKGVEVLERKEDKAQETIKPVNGHQIESIEALPEKEQEELSSEDDIAWEYKLPEPPTPFQDTPITSNLDPLTSASESPSRSLSPDSLSDTTLSSPVPRIEEPVRKDVLDAVQDLRWDVGETRTEPEEVEEEVIVPIKVEKSPKIFSVNAKTDERVLVLSEKINEESQTEDNSLEFRSDLKEKAERVQGESVQRQKNPNAITTENGPLVEERIVSKVEDPKISEIKEIQGPKAKDEELVRQRSRADKEEDIPDIAMDLSVKHYEDVAVTELPPPVKKASCSSSSSSRKSSVSYPTDEEEGASSVTMAPKPEERSTDEGSSPSNTYLPCAPFAKTCTEEDLDSSSEEEHIGGLECHDKDIKRDSLSSLQKSESLALRSRPKVLKRQASFGESDQELARVLETPAISSQKEETLQITPKVTGVSAQSPHSVTPCSPAPVERVTAPETVTKVVETQLTPTTSSDTPQPVNLELFMQAQQLLSKAAENMGNQQLQEEFIRLQQQFLSWQQQLLANQQILQSKLAQSLQSEPPKESSLSQEEMISIFEKEPEKIKQGDKVEEKGPGRAELEKEAQINEKQVAKARQNAEEWLGHRLPSSGEESTRKIEIVEKVQVQEKEMTISVVEQFPKVKIEEKAPEKPAEDVEKPVTNVTKSSEDQVSRQPIYRYQGPPTIKLEPWRPGRPKSEIIDFSRDASFFLPDQLAQPSETRKNIRELVQQTKLELLIKPPTLPKPSDVKIVQSHSTTAPEPKLKVVVEEPKIIVKEEPKVIHENQMQTKPILTKQVTLPSTILFNIKSHDIPSPVTPNQPPSDIAPPPAATNVPFRPTLVRRASIGTPKPFELKPAPLRKMQFPIRAPEVRGFAPLKAEVLLSQNPSSVNTVGAANPKPNNQMRDKLIVSARRPSAELKPLEMEELAKLSEKKATVSPSGPPPAPVPPPLTLPILRPTPLRKPVMLPKTGLDPREELMIAIRNFTANGGLRKNGNVVLLSGS